jgi:hypothetical protein
MGKASRAKRRNRDLRKQQAVIHQSLLARVQQSLPDEQVKVVKRRTGRKVSEVLMEFAQPWLDETRNDNETRAIIGMAVLAWNMALISEPKRWEGVSHELDETLREAGKAILKKMITRKLSLYSDEHRLILDYEITGTGDNLTVNVAYSLSPEEVEDIQ